jgi:hypothetical protein
MGVADTSKSANTPDDGPIEPSSLAARRCLPCSNYCDLFSSEKSGTIESLVELVD